MVRRHNRLLVAFHVGTDAVLGMLAFVIAYMLRFETGYIAITRGHPPVEQYLNVLPFVALIVPLALPSCSTTKGSPVLVCLSSRARTINSCWTRVPSTSDGISRMATGVCAFARGGGKTGPRPRSRTRR